MVKYRLRTLVDITETHEHRGPDQKRTSQQANYNTVIQILGLRSNVMPQSVTKRIRDVTGMGFGSQFIGVQKYWEMLFDTEQESHQIQHMIQDFYLVPVIIGLDETAKLNTSIFDTTSRKHCNVVFEELGE